MVEEEGGEPGVREGGERGGCGGCGGGGADVVEGGDEVVAEGGSDGGEVGLGGDLGRDGEGVLSVGLEHGEEGWVGGGEELEGVFFWCYGWEGEQAGSDDVFKDRGEVGAAEDIGFAAADGDEEVGGEDTASGFEGEAVVVDEC